MSNASFGQSAGTALSLSRAASTSQPFVPCPIRPPGQGVVTDADLSSLVSRFPVAIFLVNPDGRILYKNERADRLLAKRDVVQWQAGKLVLNAPQSPRLQALLSAAAEKTGDTATNVPIPPTGPNGSFWIAQIRTRPYEAAREAATFAVLLREAVLALDGAADLVSDLFALTPAERRALPAVLRLGHLEQVAHSLGVSVTTVRSHLKSIFAKTATTRKNDLLKLVARFAMALTL